MRINEIFYSLQGEGFFTGTPAVFVRFSGCNLRCPFCDTNHKAFVRMSEEEIVEAVCRFPARHVCSRAANRLCKSRRALWICCT